MILRLPDFAQLAVIQQLELFECFFLGSLSKKSRRLVQRSTRKKVDATAINLVKNMIEVQKRGEKGQGIVMWTTYGRKETKIMKKFDQNMWIKLEYDGIEMNCRMTFMKYPSLPLIWCDSEHYNMFSLALQSAICDVFNISKLMQVKMNFSKSALEEEFPPINEIDHLIEYEPERIKQGFLERFLKRVKVKHSLTINSCLEFNSFSPILSVDHLRYYSSFYLTRKSLLNFNGKTGMFERNCSLQDQDLIDFVITWQDGTNTKLESMCIQRDRTERPFDREKIFKMFKTMPWDPKKRDGRFKYPENTMRIQFNFDILDCTQQLDIEREHDGLLATIIVTDRIFCFFVWHTPFAKPGTNLPVMEEADTDQPPKYFLGSVVF